MIKNYNMKKNIIDNNYKSTDLSIFDTKYKFKYKNHYQIDL